MGKNRYRRGTHRHHQRAEPDVDHHDLHRLVLARNGLDEDNDPFERAGLSINAICSNDAATMRETLNERISPAAVERRMTSTEV